MNRIRKIAIVLLICGVMAGCEMPRLFQRTISFDSPSQQIAFKQGAYTSFDNQTYQFSYGTATLNEYVPRGEDISSWKTLLAVELFLEDETLADALERVTAPLKKDKITYQILENKSLGMTSVNYVLSRGGYYELNVWKFEENKRGRGVVGRRYAKTFAKGGQAELDLRNNQEKYVRRFLEAQTFPFIY